VWPWLLIGCAVRVAPVPIDAEHVGPRFDPPRFPLVPLWVDAAPECEHLAEALRFVLSTHAQQMLLPSAKTRIRIARCETTLDERITLDADRTAEMSGTAEALDAVLTGRASLDLEIWREGELLDDSSYDVIHVERQEWVGGEIYPWRGPVTGLTERDLVEKVEASLMTPHPTLRPETRMGVFISDTETSTQTR